MIDVLLAIAPIFLLIALGMLMKAKGGFSEDFWRQLEKLTFNGLFPALLFVKISAAHIDWHTALPIAATIVVGIHVAAVVAWPLRRLLKLDAPRFVAVFQGGFRSNAYVGMAIVLGILGDRATGAMAITLLAVAITINFLGVWGHLKWLDMPGKTRGWYGVAIDCAKNPLIQACILGAAFNVTGWGLPPVIGPTLDLLSRAGLPIGLMAVGAGLSLTAVKDAGLPVTASTIVKLVVQPAATYAIGRAVGLDGLTLIVPTVFAALPTSSTSYVVSRRMGSDAHVMAAIVTLSHLAAIITLPVLLTLIR